MRGRVGLATQVCVLSASLSACGAAVTNVPAGTVTKYAFSGSKVFPGTVRDYWIYVPAQYDGKSPACVHVNQDGVQFNLPAVMDRLIASGEMPVTVGVFVAPGRVKALSTNALDRFNRSFEYDGMGDGYARFLLTELLPHVVKSHGLNLSTNGNDRSIGGSSSGAVCAFTAAWERPDAFSRVLSAVGTYVGLRGGNDYPTLVRKTEPKPLRVFLQDGSADLNIYCGDWWMANQELERALAFAGYEVNHAWDDGGHNGKGMAAVCEEAMRWLWRGWPAPIQKGMGSPQMRDLLLPGEGWLLVSSGYGFTEGPAANARGEVFFNDIPASRTWKIGLDGRLSVAAEGTRNANGMAFAVDGRRYEVSASARHVAVRDAAGLASVVATGIAGNDVAICADGSLYVTAPGAPEPASNAVWLVRADGAARVVDTGLKFPNGVELSPDQSLLYVCDSSSHWVYSYQIQPDGTLAHKQRYDYLHQRHNDDDSGADGMCCDRDGRLYVATKLGVQVCDQTGRVNCILQPPSGRCSSVCFGGPAFDTLFVTGGDSVYMRKLKVRGLNPAQGAVRPAAPRL